MISDFNDLQDYFSSGGKIPPFISTIPSNINVNPRRDHISPYVTICQESGVICLTCQIFGVRGASCQIFDAIDLTCQVHGASRT